MKNLNFSVGVIDCYSMVPEINSFNWMVSFLPYQLYYHHAGQHGIETLSYFKHDAYIILGSASHITENLEWHSKLKAFIQEKLDHKIPILGFCFAHQLIANYFNGIVDYNHSSKEKFTAIQEIKITNTLKDILQDQRDSLHLLVAHAQQVKSMPDQFEVLGSRDHNPFDIIKHQTHKLILAQAHPEAFMLTEEKMNQYGLDNCQKVMRDGELFIKSTLNYLLGEKI